MTEFEVQLLEHLAKIYTMLFIQSSLLVGMVIVWFIAGARRD